MNVKTVAVIAVVCSLGLLSGCASWRHKGDSRDLASSLSNDPSNPVDTAYVAQVNHQANQRFAVVLWVNPPHKADKVDKVNLTH